MSKIKLLFCVLLPLYTTAQQINWLHTVGDIQNDYGQFIVVDSLGFTYVAGYSNGTLNFGNTTVFATTNPSFLAKYDTAGNDLWAINPHGIGSSGLSITGLKLNSKGELYCVGITVGDVGAGEGILRKYDANGFLLDSFIAPFHGPIMGIDIDGKDNYAIYGYYSGSNPTQSYFAKFNSNDSLIQNVNVLGNIDQLAVTQEGAIIIVGQFQNTVTIKDFYSDSVTLHAIQGILDFDQFFAKYDSTGRLEWAKNSDSIEIAYTPIAVNNGNDDFYLAYDHPSDISIFLNDFTLTKFDKNGNRIWSKDAACRVFNPGHVQPALKVIHDELYMLVYGFSPDIASDILWFFPPTPLTQLKLSKYDLEGTLSAQLAGPVTTDMRTSAGDFAVYGNDLFLTGGVAGYGNWDNQSINTTNTNFDLFILKMGLNNLVATTIEPVNASAAMFCYPNPASDILQLHLASREDAIVALFSEQGSLLKKFSVRQVNNQLDVSSLLPGIYFLNCVTEKGVNTVKLVKN